MWAYTAQDPGAWILPPALLPTNLLSRRLAASQTDTGILLCQAQWDIQDRTRQQGTIGPAYFLGWPGPPQMHFLPEDETVHT